MRTRIKLFYKASWESGMDLEDECRSWLERFENSQEHVGFLKIAKQAVGNWIIVWYKADKIDIG